MLKLVTHVGDNGIYTEAGDKVGMIFNNTLADDIVDALNLDAEELKTDDEKELLEHLKRHKIETTGEIDYYVKSKELQEKAESQWDEIYNVFTDALVWDGLSESQIDDLNNAIATMKTMDKLTDYLSVKEMKAIAEKKEIKLAEKEAERIISNAKKYVQKIFTAMEKNIEEMKKLLEEKP